MTDNVDAPQIDVKAMQKAIDDGLKEAMKFVSGTYLGTYHNWELENVPKWKVAGPATRGGVRYHKTTTNNTPYVWVDEGTDGPYEIVAKNAPFLSFKVGGSPKTFKGSLMSTSGSPGTNWVSKQAVIHPGIDSRDFTLNTAKEVGKEFPDIMQEHIDGAVS